MAIQPMSNVPNTMIVIGFKIILALQIHETTPLIKYSYNVSFIP